MPKIIAGIIAGIALVLACSGLHAAELDLGDTRISVRNPGGMARLTSDIQPLHSVSLDMTAPTNVRLVTYVDEAIIPRALAGEMPTFERYINVETARGLRSLNVTAADFSVVRNSMRETLHETIEQMRSKLPDGMANLSDRVSDTLDFEVAFSINNMVPLPIHHETDRTVANSSIIRYEVTDGTGTRQLIVTTTTTMVFLKDRLLFVYVFGGPDDLEWTRSAARQWIDEIISLNPAAQARGRVSGAKKTVVPN